MGLWKFFKRFWHDQITTPNGDIDGSRVGLLIVLIGAAYYVYFAYYAIVVKGQAWDPSAYGDGLVKVGAALLAAAAGVGVKSGSEVPYNPAIAAANFPNDPGVQAAVDKAAQGVQMTLDGVSTLAQDELTQAQTLAGRLKIVWQAIKGIFK
jgi:hypothetical protein